PQACSSRAGGKKRLEDLGAQLRRNPRSVVVELAYYGIPHVAGAGDYMDAAIFLMAMLPRIAHEIPEDLVQVTAVEQHLQVLGTLHDDAAGRYVLGLHDFLDERGDEVLADDHLRLLAVATIELQHLAHDAVDALGVVANHRQQALTFGRDRAVFLQKLRGLVDRRQRVTHLVRDACSQPSHRRQLDLLRLALRATQILEVNERSTIDARSDAHQAHAQQPLRRLHL